VLSLPESGDIRWAFPPGEFGEGFSPNFSQTNSKKPQNLA
jgi:hypothetical protein